MIANEIQLRYIIRDKTQSETNSVRDKSQSKKISENFFPAIFFQRKFFEKNFVRKKILRYFLGLNFVLDCILSQTEFVSDTQCDFSLSCLRQIDAYHH